MIRVGYILTSVGFGGAEKVSLTFLNNVDRSRFDICPILLVRPWEEENVLVGRLREAEYDIYKIPVAIRPRSGGRDYFRILRCLRDLRSIVTKNSFNLIHTHGYFADIIGMPVSKILGIPHISTCHGFISNDMNLKLYNWLDKCSLHFCGKIIAVSEEIKNDLLKNGINESKIVVIQNAVQNSYKEGVFDDQRAKKRDLLSIRKDEFVIGYVGRLSEEKGVQYLIEAGSILKEDGQAFKILIIGDGPKRKQLEDLTKKKGLEKEAIFTGFQSDVEEWLPALDVFVLPSLTEGTPLALLEAMGAGIPVVATSVGGVPEVIEAGVNGFLINPGDSRELVEILMILFRSPHIRKKVATEALNLIQGEYNVEEWCLKIETQYNLVLSN